MDTVLLKQFEEYLTLWNINANNNSSNVSNSTIKRKKRSAPMISKTLSESEVLDLLRSYEIGLGIVFD